MKNKARLYGELFLVSATLSATLAALAYITTRSPALAAVSALLPIAFAFGVFIALEIYDGG